METSTSSWLNTRSAGVLAHISSLPGDFGIGNLGPAARHFVDFLSEANIRHWQICPLGPTGYGDSPYQAFSSMAGNPYFIDLGALISTGLLKEAEVAALRELPRERSDYGALYERFWPVLALAYDRFAASGAEKLPGFSSFELFHDRHASWLDPYSNYMALKAHFGGRAWTTWPEQFRTWNSKLPGLMPASAQLDAERHRFYQYVFFGQWEQLRRYASKRGVAIIGDIPIFVALDSADTWQSRAVFRLDYEGQPLAVAGVPPDYFSASGQLWGNPLYDWSHLEATGYAWWTARLKAAFELFDIIRLDHFRGFDTYYEIPAGAPDARTGTWQKGPGLPFFKAIKAALPHARIIAEDLGYIGPDVVALRRDAGLPGMKILQFAYGHDAHNTNQPHCFPQDSVAYTGTHDNNTCRGWLESMDPTQARQIDDYFQLQGNCSAWPMIRHLLATVSRLAVIPLPDLLDLPSSATFNRPGTSEGNWQWRFSDEQLASLRSERVDTLRHWITLYDRRGDHEIKDYSEPLNEPPCPVFEPGNAL